MPSSTTVELQGIRKTFARSVAVDQLDLQVSRGEFFSLLGPSGCGKTTTLRMLGGFLVPDAGRILLDGGDVTKVPPYRRDVNTVFQSYALFGHLSVADNVAFGLRRRKVGRAEIRRRVGDMLALVDLTSRASARPAELSGGQRQRVALARSLVNMPKLLLLDEPLGALDLKLRRAMQVELKRIQREVGITFVYVTHDQEEALTMSDRIGVMNHGRLEQIGEPAALYERPETAFVAGFIGSSNLLRGMRTADGVKLDSGQHLAAVTGPGVATPAGTALAVSLRPESIRLGTACEGTGTALQGRIVERTYLGASTQYAVECHGDLRLIVSEPTTRGGTHRREVGEEVIASWSPTDAVVLTADDTTGGTE